MTNFWKNFIKEKKLESEIKINKLFLKFLNDLEVVRLDYDEYDDKNYGEIGIYYYDFKRNGEPFEVRQTDFLEDPECKVIWGLPLDSPDEYFDNWLEKTFQLDEDEVEWFLDALEEYFLEYYGKHQNC